MSRAVVLALAVLAGLAEPLHASEPRLQLEQRIRLTAQLLNDSPTAQRIGASGNSQAVAHLNEGRVHHAISEDALARGDLDAARRNADEALRHVALARRMVPDAPARAAAVRQRHDLMISNLDRLLDAWARRLPVGDADDGDRVAAIALMDTARYFAREGRFEESVHVLASAESHVLAGMKRLLDAREVDYTQRPATPAEEFRLELQRHQALSDLVPLALREMRPRPDAAALINRYSEASAALRDQAQRRFQDGQSREALADLRNAMLYLQRALGAAGVTTPPASEVLQ